MSLQLQMYSDGSFGYLNEDGNEKNNLTTGARVVCQQKEDESREDFITNNHIIFKPNEYGSVEDNDERIIKRFYCLSDLVKKGYAIDKISAVAIEKFDNGASDTVISLIQNGYDLDKWFENRAARTLVIKKAIEDNIISILEKTAQLEQAPSRFVKGTLEDYTKYIQKLYILGYYNEKWLHNRYDGDIINILNAFDSKTKITDTLYREFIDTSMQPKGHDLTSFYQKINKFNQLGYDVSMLRNSEDAKVRFIVFDPKYFNEYIDDKSSKVREKVYMTWDGLGAKAKLDFINNHIEEIMKYESSYFKIIEYAIDHKMQVDYILKTTKNSEFKEKISLGDAYVSNYVHLDNLKKYCLNNSNAHLPEHSSQGHFSISIKALKADKIEIIIASDASAERIAVNGPKVRGDGLRGCRDGIYYKCLLPLESDQSELKEYVGKTFYVHESVFTKHAILTVKKGLFEEN